MSTIHKPNYNAKEEKEKNRDIVSSPKIKGFSIIENNEEKLEKGEIDSSKPDKVLHLLYIIYY